MAGCAIESDYVYLAGRPDGLDSDERFTRMCLYDAQIPGPNKWKYHDLPDWRVVSVAVQPASEGSPRRLCALSENGDIEFDFVGGRSQERVPDAGLAGFGGPGYGYVASLKCVGTRLFVCGDSGQVYRKGSDGWQHTDAGLLAHPNMVQSTTGLIRSGDIESLANRVRDRIQLHDIAGLQESDMYAVGDQGRIFHYDGAQWTAVPTSIDEALVSVHCIDSGRILVAGSNGALLQGNHRSGFVDLSGIDDNETFTSVRTFSGHVFVASSTGVWTLTESGLARVKTGLTPELRDAHHLDVAGGVLWSFGFKDLAFYDGKQWNRVRHPDNP